MGFLPIRLLAGLDLKRPLFILAAAIVAQASLGGPTHAAECYVLIAGAKHSAVRVETSAQLSIPRIAWRPPSENAALDLWISYRGSSIESMQRPSGGYSQLAPPIPQRHVNVFEFITQNGKVMSLAAKPATYGHFTFIATPTAGFASSDPEVSEIIRAAKASETISVRAVEIDEGKPDTVAQATFDLGATASRDDLLRQAKAEIDKDDPQACPAPSYGPPLMIPPVSRAR